MNARRARWLAVLAALALLLAACGGDDDGGGGTASQGGEDGGASGEPITIGLLVPETGAVAQTAEQVKNMITMVTEQVNADGGVDGRPIEVRVYDTELEPEVAAQQAQRAITQDQVTAIVGPWATSEALAVADVVERAGVVDVNYSAATPEITAGRDFVFRTSPLTPDLAAGMVDLAVALGAEDAVLLYDSGGFGLGAVGPIEEAAEAAGFDLVESIEYPINASDVSAEVSRAAATDPGAVLIAGSTGADYGLVAKAMVEQGLEVPYIGFSPIVLPDAIDISAGAYDVLPVYTLQTADTTKPLYQELLDAYNEQFEPVENLPEQVLGAHDALVYIVDGLRETGGEGGEALATALEELPPREGANGRTGSTQQFADDKHDANTGDYLVPYKLENGQPVQDTSLEL